MLLSRCDKMSWNNELAVSVSILYSRHGRILPFIKKILIRSFCHTKLHKKRSNFFKKFTKESYSDFQVNSLVLRKR